LAILSTASPAAGIPDEMDAPAPSRRMGSGWPRSNDRSRPGTALWISDGLKPEVDPRVVKRLRPIANRDDSEQTSNINLRDLGAKGKSLAPHYPSYRLTVAKGD
jgi:hypothetical protein